MYSIQSFLSPLTHLLSLLLSYPFLALLCPFNLILPAVHPIFLHLSPSPIKSITCFHSSSLHFLSFSLLSSPSLISAFLPFSVPTSSFLPCPHLFYPFFILSSHPCHPAFRLTRSVIEGLTYDWLQLICGRPHTPLHPFPHPLPPPLPIPLPETRSVARSGANDLRQGSGMGVCVYACAWGV